MATFQELTESPCWNSGRPGKWDAEFRMISEREAIQIALVHLCGSEIGYASVEVDCRRPDYTLRPDYVGDRDTMLGEYGWLFWFRVTNPPGFFFEPGAFFLFVHDPSGKVERTLAK